MSETGEERWHTDHDEELEEEEREKSRKRRLRESEDSDRRASDEKEILDLKIVSAFLCGDSSLTRAARGAQEHLRSLRRGGFADSARDMPSFD